LFVRLTHPRRGQGAGSSGANNAGGAATHSDNDWVARSPDYHLGRAEEQLRLWRDGDRLLAFGDIPNERENGKEFLGRNRRPEQTQMLEDLKFALSHVATSQERVIFSESLP
jgi:hypothetical protein